MGNSTIKRQVLTAAVTLTLFTLGSVGVATAGLVFEGNIVTKLEGKFKGGKEWCGPALGMALGDAVGEKEKIKEDVTVWVEFSDFPDLTGVVRMGVFDIAVDGFGVRKNEKKGFFSVEGDFNDEFEDPDFFNWTQLSMEGKYKVNDSGVPIKLKGTFHYYNAAQVALDPLTLGEICVTNGGKFDVKGDGAAFVFPGADPDPIP